MQRGATVLNSNLTIRRDSVFGGSFAVLQTLLITCNALTHMSPVDQVLSAERVPACYCHTVCAFYIGAATSRVANGWYQVAWDSVVVAAA